MQLHAFDYGETPSDVICDRWEQLDPLAILRRVSRECALFTESDTSQEHAAEINAALALLPFRSADDLLTVLDALLLTTNVPAIWPDTELANTLGDPEVASARALRLNILSALNIKEI